MYSFRLKLVEIRFQVATRSTQAEHHQHRRFFAASGCRCDASWRRAHSRGGTWRASAPRELGVASSCRRAEE